MLDKKYNHKEVEKNKYNNWKENGYFECNDNSNKKPFCVVLPPPNVTGKLHLGHALDVTLQDIIIRYKKMLGFDTLWLPGMDHAAIATEAKVVKRIKDKGLDKRSIGRDKFLDECWSWTKEHSDIIRSQWAKLGISLDYSKERFTLDDGLSEAVRRVFVDFYNEGLIYRGERIINWDPVAQTALSSEEVIYKDDPGAFYHIKYFIDGEDDFLDIATTRPETLFGDTAVAVNPKDDRYKKYVGKNVILPILNKKIPIIADIHADPEFGTGCVKITPAHDPNDFEVGNRHNLDRVVIMNKDATMNINCGSRYVGLTREECRKKLVSDLKDNNLLIKVEEMVHAVGHSERTDAVIEPYLSKQWFVKMRPLADNVLNNQKKKSTKVNFVPSRYEKIMNHWMEITYDWCISRQLWWGHRIPAWYKGEEVYVGMEAPKGDGWVQDDDVLDTWFSSALWPFATLGWPNNTKLLDRYYPNSCLVTGYDIIPFWVNRMTFQGEKLLGKRPFETCLIHGLIRDKEGRKFSKSLGNGIDPFDMIDEYGADALRYYLATAASNGTDIRFDDTKIKSNWNYINKIWNAARFVISNISDLKKVKFDKLKNEDKWIITRYEKMLDAVIKFMNKYEFNNAGSLIYDFVWFDFCDNYIEMPKFSIEEETTKSVLYFILNGILKLLHPFMPYVTDELYSSLPFKDSENIMISDYPKVDKKLIYEDEEKVIDNVKSFVTTFRNFKLENKIGKDILIKINDDGDYDLILKLLKLRDKVVKEDLDKDKYSVSTSYYSIDVYYEKKDSEEDNKLRENNINKLKASIDRREKLLSNKNYVNKAPKELVENEKIKLEEEKMMLDKLLNN